MVQTARLFGFFCYFNGDSDWYAWLSDTGVEISEYSGIGNSLDDNTIIKNAVNDVGLTTNAPQLLNLNQQIISWNKRYIA